MCVCVSFAAPHSSCSLRQRGWLKDVEEQYFSTSAPLRISSPVLQGMTTAGERPALVCNVGCRGQVTVKITLRSIM